LGSATPSLESWVRAKNGRYQLTRLPARYQDQPLPDVRVVDLATVEFNNMYPFSPTLIEAIKVRLERKEQTVLFLNRRGIATALLCLQCRRRVTSPESLLPFTVHHTAHGRPYLLDHTSGQIADVPPLCPHCQSPKLHAVGAGTQKIELILQKLFPAARLLRADSDTIQHPEEMRTLLRKMRDREADILLGTQSVVKGLDLPEVTLAAVLIADVGLSLPHFRAGERVFQLLTQLTGRSGRRKPGEVIIQTFRPDSEEVKSAAKHETEQYLEKELKIRLYSGYPPASKMIRILFREDDAERRAKRAQGEALAAVSALGAECKVSVAPTLFGGGKVWQVLLRGPQPEILLPSMDLSDAAVDVDPVETV
jgi:primosomal protein N' (replication factor Y) (superfamily II helicase)